MGESDNVKCAECGSSFNRMFLMGKQGNANVCPMCGGKLTGEEEHPDWITWYYYKSPAHLCPRCIFRDTKAGDLLSSVRLHRVYHFKPRLFCLDRLSRKRKGKTCLQPMQKRILVFG